MKSDKPGLQVCAFLGCYTRNTDRKPIFLDILTLEDGIDSCPETSVRIYHYMLRKNSEESRYHLYRCGSLQPRRDGIPFVVCLNL